MTCINFYFLWVFQTFRKSIISFWSWVQHLANSVNQIFLPYLIILIAIILIISSSSPVVEILQLVHDPVHMTVIVMGCQVVNSAAKGLASIKEGIKPICIATSRGRTDQNLNINDYFYAIIYHIVFTLSGYFVCSSIQAAAASSGAMSDWSAWLGYLASTSSVMSSCQGLSVSS